MSQSCECTKDKPDPLCVTSAHLSQAGREAHQAFRDLERSQARYDAIRALYLRRSQ